MNAAAELTRSGSTLYLQGDLNFATVAALYQQLQQQLVEGVKQLDCTGVRQADSAAISLLLSGLRLARRRRIDLQVGGLSGQILSLVRLYDVESLFT